MGAVVVTGAAGGVGSAIVARLRAGGVPVVEVDVIPPRASAADDVVVGDGGDPRVAEQAVARAAELGGLSGWVNNSAVFTDRWLDADGADAVFEVIAANLRPALTGSAAAIAAFRHQGTGGAVVNVSSHQATRPVRGAVAYATAKAALEGLTRALAVDHGPDGIRVNAVALGSIRTARSDAHEAALPDEARDEFRAAIGRIHPLGRMGESAEVADVVAFLLSDAAAFVSGVVLPVDGGRSARGDDPETRSR